MVRKNRKTLSKLEEKLKKRSSQDKEELKRWQRKISAYETRILNYDQELLSLAQLDDDRFDVIAWRANFIETLGKERKIANKRF